MIGLFFCETNQKQIKNNKTTTTTKQKKPFVQAIFVPNSSKKSDELGQHLRYFFKQKTKNKKQKTKTKQKQNKTKTKQKQNKKKPFAQATFVPNSSKKSDELGQHLRYLRKWLGDLILVLNSFLLLDF